MISIPYWSLPAAISAVSFTWFVFRGAKETCSFDLKPLFNAILIIIINLVVWLIYFIIF